jgi:hypothetical protein
MNQQNPEELHTDPANWKWGIFYVCRADPRIIVPKRIRGLGWTINLGQPMALPFVMLLVAIAVGVVELSRALGATGDTMFAIKIALAVGIIGLCYYLAHRKPKGLS